MRVTAQGRCFILLSITLALCLSCNRTRGEEGYQFNTISSRDVRPIANRFTVKVFLEKDAEQAVGSGFVIDDQNGLVLTAAHVIKNAHVIKKGISQVWLAFPGRTHYYPAKVVAQQPYPASGDGHYPGATDNPDLAILELMTEQDTPGPGLNSPDVQLESIDDAQGHWLIGFGRFGREPEIAPAPSPAKNEECLYTIRGETVHGDSGSAFMADNGLVDGIAIYGAETKPDNSGIMNEAWILPLACVRDKLLPFVSDDENAMIMKTLNSGDERMLSLLFQPPHQGNKWITNLHIARAVTDFIVDRRNKKATAELGIDRASKAFQILFERRVGRKLAMELLTASVSVGEITASAQQGIYVGDSEHTETASVPVGEIRHLVGKYVKEYLKEHPELRQAASAAPQGIYVGDSEHQAP
jgi:hypothetical protein